MWIMQKQAFTLELDYSVWLITDSWYGFYSKPQIENVKYIITLEMEIIYKQNQLGNGIWH